MIDSRSPNFISKLLCTLCGRPVVANLWQWNIYIGTVYKRHSARDKFVDHAHFLLNTPAPVLIKFGIGNATLDFMMSFVYNFRSHDDTVSQGRLDSFLGPRDYLVALSVGTSHC